MYNITQFLAACQKAKEFPWNYDFKKCYCRQQDFKKCHAIQNLLKYKHGKFTDITGFNISKKTGAGADCDKEAFPVYQLLGWQKDMRHIIRGETINSFITTFNQAIIKSANKKAVFASLGINEALHPGKISALLSANRHYEKFDIIADNLAGFEEFALRTHTIGNFTVLPHWMNTGRYTFSRDYWDITLKSLYDFLQPVNAWQNFINKYYLQIFVNEDFTPCELWQGHFSASVLPAKDQISQFLSNVNLRICKRGKLLTKILCEKINRTDFAFYQQVKHEAITFANTMSSH